MKPLWNTGFFLTHTIVAIRNTRHRRGREAAAGPRRGPEAFQGTAGWRLHTWRTWPARGGPTRGGRGVSASEILSLSSQSTKVNPLTKAPLPPSPGGLYSFILTNNLLIKCEMLSRRRGDMLHPTIGNNLILEFFLQVVKTNL